MKSLLELEYIKPIKMTDHKKRHTPKGSKKVLYTVCCVEKKRKQKFIRLTERTESI